MDKLQTEIDELRKVATQHEQIIHELRKAVGTRLRLVRYIDDMGKALNLIMPFGDQTYYLTFLKHYYAMVKVLNEADPQINNILP